MEAPARRTSHRSAERKMKVGGTMEWNHQWSLSGHTLTYFRPWSQHTQGCDCQHYSIFIMTSLHAGNNNYFLINLL